MRKSLVLTMAAASLLSVGSAALAGAWVPANAPAGASDFDLFGINNKNIVTGYYINSSGVELGVTGPFDGSHYENIDDGGGLTMPRGIGPTGIITGFDAATTYPWERSAKGKLKNITLYGNPVTGIVQQVNKSGVFVGDQANSSEVAIGRKYKFTGLIRLKLCNTGCAGRAIDDAGDIGGWYLDSSTSLQRGYVKLANQKTPIQVDYPNAYYTVVEGMNNKGIVAGQWEDVSGLIHGFTYNISSGKFEDLDIPGSSLTQVWGISNNDVVAASSDIGSYVYCIKARTCPAAGGVVHQHRIPGYRPLPP